MPHPLFPQDIDNNGHPKIGVKPVTGLGKGTGLKISPQERLEMWMAAASMELLPAKDKIRFGRHLLSEISPGKHTPQHFWSLSRIGARELLYGPADRVIPPDVVSSWIEEILSKKWHNPKPAGIALAHMARKTGDRVRDVDSSVTDRLIEWLNGFGSFKPQIRIIQEAVPMHKQEQSEVFGESLPSGLVMHS